MNLLIYFCIPLVVTGRMTRGTYGQQVEKEDDEAVAVIDTEPANQETAETHESYANFYPGHLDYENPELKDYALDHQDGSYYRKGVGEAAVLSKPAVIAASRGKGLLGDHLPENLNLFNSLRDKVGANRVKTGIPPEVGGGVGVAGLAGVDPRYAALLSGQYGLGYSHKLAPAVVPAGPLSYPQALIGGHEHHAHSPIISPHHLGDLSSLGLYSSPLSPYASPAGLGYPLAHHHAGLDEQLPVAQHVVPTLQAPLVKAAVPAYTAPVLKTAAVPHVLLKSPVHAPTILKEVPSPLLLNSDAHLLHPSPLVLKSAQHTLGYPPHLLQGPLLKSAVPSPLLLKSAVPSLYSAPFLKTLAAGPLVHQPVLKATVGAGLPAPLLKTAPGVEATIVPAIEEPIPEEIPVISKAPAFAFSPAFSPYSAIAPLYLAPKALPPKVVIQKTIIEKPAVFADKAVLKAALSPAYLHPSKAILKAPLLAQYGGHIEPGLPAKILSTQKDVVKALIASDAKRGYKGHLHGAHIELMPSLSYGFSYSLYPDTKGHYGHHGKPLGYHDDPHHHHHAHIHEDVHDHHHHH